MDKLSLLWAIGGWRRPGPILLPVIVVVFGGIKSGSAGGLIWSFGLLGSLFGINGEFLSSSGKGNFHVFAKVYMIRKLLAPK
jgi:hypothetical protein